MVLLAESRWQDGTIDDVNVETIVPMEWVERHNVRVGAKVPLPLDLIEMGLPERLRVTVLSVEPCPAISSGPGRVVLTTINHLNSYVVELRVADSQGGGETLRPTGFHKFYSETRSGWISAADLHQGEHLRGIGGSLTVVSVSRVPGVHRVYNMTVEDEHVYRVSTLGALVHNMDCTEYANRLQKEKGGNVQRIQPDSQYNIASRDPTLGPYELAPGESWYYHDVLENDGLIFDEFTGPNGMPIEKFKALWDNAPAINFGF